MNNNLAKAMMQNKLYLGFGQHNKQDDRQNAYNSLRSGRKGR
jgi:hypothetical protein